MNLRFLRGRWVLGLGVGGFLGTVSILAGLTALPSRAEEITASNVVEHYQKLLDTGAAELRYAEGKGSSRITLFGWRSYNVFCSVLSMMS